MPSILETLTPGLDRVVMDTLGDTIRYKAVGAPAYVETLAHGDYRDQAQELEGAQVMAQDMRFAVLKADVPVKPTKAARIQLPKIAGATFCPVNVGNDESGTHWEFDLQRVSGG
jgi:hypothetical protein